MIARTTLAYGLVSATCLVCHNAVLILGDRVGLPLWAGVALSFALVAAVGYVLHSRVTFRERLGLVRFLRYALAMSANLPLAFVLTWLGRAVAGLPMTLAAPLASAAMVAVNFVLSHWAIRTPRKERRI